jgi:hypothetical protein
VAIVLAFSYFAPVLGVNVDPVKHHDDANCGRNGYGYHGGKHNFVCPTRPPAANPDNAPVKGAVSTQSPIIRSQSPATPAGSSVTTPATKKVVVGVPVSAGVGQWRGFTDLVRRQLS